jgi:O-antigen ligase
VIPIILVMTMAVNTLVRLRRLLFVQTASVAAVVAVTLFKGSYSYGRLYGAVRGIYLNPNELALAIVMTFPLAMAFLLRTRNAVRKFIWGPILVLMAFGLLKTVSRAGFIALLVAVAVCLWEFGLKGRRPYLFVLTGIVALVLFFSSSGALGTRLSGIFNPQDNLGSAYGSADARRKLLRLSLEVTAEHPLLGVGPGNFQVLTGFWEQTHNSYTQLSSEAGVPALLIYLMIFWRAFANIRAVKRDPGAPAENLLFAGALRASLVGYLVGSFFDSVAYEFFPYILVAYTTSLFRIREAPIPVSSGQSKVELQARPTKEFKESYGQMAKLETPRNFS